MAITTLADLKAQLSFTDDLGAVDDGLLTRINAAANGFVERKLGFTFADTFGGVGQEAVPDGLRQAVLMLGAHWYESREAAAETLKEPPFGVSEIIQEYRNWSF